MPGIALAGGHAVGVLFVVKIYDLPHLIAPLKRSLGVPLHFSDQRFPRVRAAGQTDVTGDPATYSLYTPNDLVTAAFTARALGENDVTSDPATYNLYTAAQLADTATATEVQLVSALTTGQTDVTSDPVSYSLYTASDVTSAEAIARTAGQNDVTSDPATYSLYTSNELVTAAFTARAIEKSDIINNPTIHGLFGENTVEDVRIGAPMMRKNSEGKLLFDFQIQASDDLHNWTT